MLLAVLLLLLLLSPDSQTARGHPLYMRLSSGTLQGEPGRSEEATSSGWEGHRKNEALGNEDTLVTVTYEGLGPC